MKKGFTLIELTLSLAITAVITAAIYASINGYLNYKSNLTNKICINGIEMFISKAKIYCYSNNIEGFIFIDMDKNKLIFSSKIAEIDTYDLEKKTLYMTNFSSNKIQIKSSGKITTSGSLYFRDEKRNIHRIAIQIGSGYINDQE